MKPTFFVLSIFGLLASVHSAWADAFLLSNGIFTTINVPGASGTAAAGINSLGQIVGSFADSTGRHGFLDTNGVFTKIDFPGTTFTEPFGINNSGQIVGAFDGSIGHAFLDSNGVFSTINFPGGDFESVAKGINNAGQIVGSDFFENEIRRRHQWQLQFHNLSVQQHQFL